MDTPAGWETGIAWYLRNAEGPATDQQTADEIARRLGGLIPRQDDGDGMWLCDTDPDLAAELRDVGYVALAEGEWAAEAEWPDE